MSAYDSETKELVKLRKAYVAEKEKLVKLKKAYTVEKGKLVKIWSGGEILYYGEITPMSKKRAYASALSFADRAFFLGGTSGNPETYDSSLTVEEVMNSYISYYQGIASVVLGSHALIVGGKDSSSYANFVFAFDESFTRSQIANTKYAFAYRCAAAIGNYAIISGGEGQGSYGKYSEVYDASLTKIELDNFWTVAQGSCATTLGDYAVLCGGYFQNQTPFFYIDASLTKASSVLDSTMGLTDSSMVTLGDYAIYAGGKGRSNDKSVGSVTNAYAIDKSMTVTTISALSASRQLLTACVLGEYALFMGGLYSASSGSSNDTSAKVVDLYDMSLTRTVGTSLTYPRPSGAASAVVGEYAIIAGGNTTKMSTPQNTAEAFYLS